MTESVFTALERRVADDPERLLYCFLDAGGREVARLTRGEFLQRVLAIAGGLWSTAAIASGRRVLLAYQPGLEMICAFFACARSGLIPVPVASPADHGAPAALRRMERIAADCGAVAVLTDSLTRETVDRSGCAAGPAPLERGALAALPWVATDTFREFVPSPRADPSPLLFLQYTSGSTRQPRGVMVSHRNVIANCRMTADHGEAVGVCWLPHQHDMGLIGYYLNNALIGGTLYALSPSSFVQRPSLWLRAITKYRATATSAPNFALELCLRRVPVSSREGLDLGSLRFLMVAAEPVKPAAYQRFLQAFAPHGLRPDALVVAYGLAENTLAVSSHGRDSLSVSRPALARGVVEVTKAVADVSMSTHLMSCGRPLGDNAVVIVDPETLRPAGPGRVGEIWIAGDSKCLGYWNDSEATAAAFRARIRETPPEAASREYLRSGDMGFLHGGDLYVCGRRKDMIVIRGENHFPQDIEAVVEADPAVRAGGVAAFEIDVDGEPAVVVVAEQARASIGPDAGEIAAAVREEAGISLGRMVFVPPKSIPKTSSGKVRRFLARQMLISGGFQVLWDYAPKQRGGLTAAPSAAHGPFASLAARYGVTGDELYTLAEAGVDSLDLIVCQHELMTFLAANGAGELSERLGFRIVQDRSISELFGLARRFETDPATAMAQLRRLVGTQDEIGRVEEKRLMRSDTRLPLRPPAVGSARGPASPRRILLTGATGFLGPFLLTSLIERTSASIDVLVRAPTVAEGRARVRASLVAAGSCGPSLLQAFESRVSVRLGDLALPNLGLRDDAWAELADHTDAIYHNAAWVNYIRTYQSLRASNVLGTKEILRLSAQDRLKQVNYISTTFVFGWSIKEILSEDDANEGMEALDFGYSQTKWVAEQLVIAARARGVSARIFRPALVTPSLQGRGSNCDITLRLLAFMIKHGIWVDTRNQISFLPADITANNIVAVSQLPDTENGTFHVTRDEYAHMGDVRRIVSALTGRTFQRFNLKDFVPEVIRRATRGDPLFPLLDFLVGSIDSIAAMEFKRYDNARYRQARGAAADARADPALEETVIGILRFLNANGLADVAIAGDGARTG